MPDSVSRRFPWEVTVIVATNLLLVGIAWGLLTASVDNLRAEIIGLKQTVESKVVLKDENNLWRQRYEERHQNIEARLEALEQRHGRNP